MTDEQDALAWLDSMDPSYACIAADHIAVLKRMLARSALPEEPTAAMLYAMSKAWFDCPPGDTWPRVYRALRAELMKPATKEVEVWRVEYAYKGKALCKTKYSAEDADIEVNHLRDLGWEGYACIRVTGPHKQEVPA